MVKVIGLTGPIGAGKDEVAALLRRSGAYIIDADQVAHSLYEAQTPVWHELIRVFGSKILNRGGKINRKKLGEIVFADEKQLKELDQIVHPHLKKAILEQIESCKSSAVSCKLIVINAAVLKEIGLADEVDEVWAVVAPKEIRLKRLIKAGLTKATALKRINAQAKQADYLKMADVVIRNEGSLAILKKTVQLKTRTAA